MYEQKIRKLMKGVAKGKLSIDGAVKKMKFLPYEDIGFAKIDHHRALRKGFPEVVFCQNKTTEQVVAIVKKLAAINSNVLATRATEEMFNEVKKHVKNAQYNKISRTIIISSDKNKARKGKILVLSAGTSDISVAEEAAVVAEVMGNNVERIYDVGVAGLHRLLSSKEKLEEASVLIIVAAWTACCQALSQDCSASRLLQCRLLLAMGRHLKELHLCLQC